MRNIPSQKLEPYISSRSSYSRHQILPIVKSDIQPVVEDPTAKNIMGNTYPIYNQSTTFNPGSRAPWSGYVSNINTESVLRNQIYPHQKNNDATAWVPESKSDLYNSNLTYRPSKNTPHKDLFEDKSIAYKKEFAHHDKIGFALFNNSTRNQLKDI